jgi:DNA repair exonuclease SbcCD ATPase subunit
MRVLTIENVISDDDIKKYSEKYDDVSKLYKDASKSFQFNSLLRKILGEEGIRKFVVSKVLPYFNSKINGYLKIMGSDLSLRFDSNLDEQIITRNREERRYGSFSAGEKKRIDISVLLSLMDLAKLQNSVDTNILILDEVLDTAMDNEGIENFLNYLKSGFKSSYPDKSVYIITHRNTISDDFYDTMIKLTKKDGFTSIDNIIDLRKQ